MRPNTPRAHLRSLVTGIRPVLAVLIILAACSPVDITRFSEAVRRVADRGIGGTGISDDDRGIGGTGIVGTITGFGSVLVNGLKVDFDQETVITDDGVLATGQALNVGQVVAINAATISGALRARSIAVVSAVSGPITAVAAAGNQIEVLGQTVSLDPRSLKAPAPANLQAGQWVTVSGLRNAQGAIVASRVSPRAVGGRISVRGPVAALTANGFRIGRLSVVAPTATQSVIPGRATLAVGALTSAGLRASQVEVAPSLPFDGQVSRLSIEGFVSRRAGQQVTISGLAVAVTDTTAVVGTANGQLSQNDRVTVEAVVDNGEAVAETIDASDPAARDSTESRIEDRRNRTARARERAEQLDRQSTATTTSVSRSEARSGGRKGGALSGGGSNTTEGGPSTADRDAPASRDSDANASPSSGASDSQGAASTASDANGASTSSGAVSGSASGVSSTDSSAGAPAAAVSANEANSSSSEAPSANATADSTAGQSSTNGAAPDSGAVGQNAGQATGSVGQNGTAQGAAGATVGGNALSRDD